MPTINTEALNETAQSALRVSENEMVEEKPRDSDKLSETLERAALLLEDIAAIKDQIGRAKADVVANQRYSDPSWYHSANRALRHKQVEHQKLLAEIGNIRREMKAKNIAQSEEACIRFERVFVRIARENLSSDVFQDLVKRAESIVSSDLK